MPKYEPALEFICRPPIFDPALPDPIPIIAIYTDGSVNIKERIAGGAMFEIMREDEIVRIIAFRDSVINSTFMEVRVIDKYLMDFDNKDLPIIFYSDSQDTLDRIYNKINGISYKPHNDITRTIDFLITQIKERILKRNAPTYFCKVKAHSISKWNDKADKAAKIGAHFPNIGDIQTWFEETDVNAALRDF